MKKVDDFSKGRRGAVVPVPKGKSRITIRIDDDILDWFREQVNVAGGGNYQTMINSALREYLANRTGHIVSRTELWDHAYDEAAEPGSNVLDVHISHLRKKIDDGHGSKLIHTRRGQGYVLGEEQ